MVTPDYSKTQYYYRLTKIDNISRLYKVDLNNKYYVYRHLNGKGAWAKIATPAYAKENIFQPISEARAKLIMKLGMEDGDWIE